MRAPPTAIATPRPPSASHPGFMRPACRPTLPGARVAPAARAASRPHAARRARRPLARRACDAQAVAAAQLEPAQGAPIPSYTHMTHAALAGSHLPYRSRFHTAQGAGAAAAGRHVLLQRGGGAAAARAGRGARAPQDDGAGPRRRAADALPLALAAHRRGHVHGGLRPRAAHSRAPPPPRRRRRRAAQAGRGERSRGQRRWRR